MRFSFYVLIIFFLLNGFSLTAQQRNNSGGIGKIRGRIVDSVSKQPIEYATISLISKEGNKVIDGTTTDTNGVFRLSNIADGNYKLLIYFIGYNNIEKSDVIISSSKPELSLGIIPLVNRQVLMKEVTVSAEKNIIENQIDKLVYNAEKDVSSQGGVATDILKKVPMVSVNADGTVELQGNGNIRFLINGKPSSVFGSNVTDVLQTIPASQIQSIEVITSPGAKYDAEGTGGIINIILKKVTIQGINGSLSLTAGSRLENGSFNLAARKGKFGINTFLSGNAQLLSTTINTLDRESSDNTSGFSSSLLQDGKSDFTRMGYQAGMSFDYEISEKDNINGGFSYNNMGTTNVGYTDRQSIFKTNSGNVVSDIVNKVDATNNSDMKAYDWNIN